MEGDNDGNWGKRMVGEEVVVGVTVYYGIMVGVWC
jgi:hypothetical protein